MRYLRNAAWVNYDLSLISDDGGWEPERGDEDSGSVGATGLQTSRVN